LEEATSALSGLSHCAGVVVVPKQERPLKHIEFVHLGPGRALVVLVTEDGLVENRVIEVPLGLPPAMLPVTTAWSALPAAIVVVALVGVLTTGEVALATVKHSPGDPSLEAE